jgi:hypothetical protein
MLLIKKKSFKSVLLAICIAAVVYIDGFFALFLHLSDAGAYNPAVAVALACTLVVLLLFARHMRAWIVIVLSVVFIILCFVSSQNQGLFLKLARDYLCIFILLASFSIISRYLDGHAIDSKIYARSLAIFIILFFPLLGLVTGLKGYDGRFPGFMLSPPIFANGVLLTYLIYRNSGLSAKSTFSFFSLAVIFIVLSGTRSPLLTLLLYEMLLLGSGEMVARNRAAYFLLIAVAGAAAFGIVTDLYVNMIGGHSQSRIFAQQDSDGGSLQTRSAWYYEIFKSLARDHYIGGFGPGAAEHLTGYITHFDILRYWYDYSILYVLVFLFAILKMYRTSSRGRFGNSGVFTALAFPFVMLNLVLVSMHNIFQAPGLLVLFSSYLIFSTPRSIEKT